jgi:hypothetical protein
MIAFQSETASALATAGWSSSKTMIVEIVETTEIRDIPSSSEVAGLITPARFPTAQRKRLLARILALGEDAIARLNNRSQERCGKLLGFL